METRQTQEILKIVDRRVKKWHTDEEVAELDQEVVFVQDEEVAGVTSQDTADVVAVGCEINLFTCGVKL